MAVDSVVMVLDRAKGVEPRTDGLFQVCRRRGLPVVTFINTLDRFGPAPLELLAEWFRPLQERPSDSALTTTWREPGSRP